MAVNVRLKHSSVDSKAPVAADLLEGEIALNINENSPAAYIKDSAGQIVKLAGADSITDEASVKKVGDNMTGDLTLGDGITDQITLDATAGTATFAGGDISLNADGSATFAGAITTTTDNNAINAVSSLTGAQAAIRVQNTNPGGTPYYLYCDSSDGKVAFIKTDGSADFASGEIKLTAAGTVDATSASYSFIGRATDGTANFAVDSNTNVVNVGPISANNSNIVLKGADGSASFAGGNLEIGSAAYLKVFDNTTNTTAALCRTNSGTSYGLTVAPADDENNFTATIAADGNVNFAGNLVVSGGTANPSDTNGIEIWDYRGSDSSWGMVINAIDRENGGGFLPLTLGSETWAVDKDGSAVFAGDVEVAGNPANGATAGARIFNNGNLQLARTAGSSDLITGYTVGTVAPTVQISANGSAYFAQMVQVGDNPFPGAGTGFAGYQDGSIAISSAVSTNTIIYGYTTGNSTPTVDIKADGSATFSGAVTLGGSNYVTANVGIGTHDSGGGNVGIVAFANNAINTNVYLGTSDNYWRGTFTTLVNGGAPFTSLGGSFWLEADDDTKYTSTTEEYEEQVEDTPFVPAVDAVVGPRGNVIKEEVPAIEATYKTVTKTREVKTYSGPVLDVKEELQSLRARATQQDETIRLMTAALKSLGIDTAAFPAPEDDEPKTRSRKKK